MSSAPTSSSTPSTSSSLAGRIALVTGASDGIGRAAAFDFAREGVSSLFLFARTKGKLEVVQQELKEKYPKVNVEILAGDVSAEETNKLAVETLVKKFGGLHIAFLNAGIYKSAGTLDKTDPTILNELIDTNIKGVLWGLKYSIPAILATSEKEKRFVGSIIVTSSVVSHLYTKVATPGAGIYAATKSFIDAIVKTAALEQAGKIRVNAVNPGVTSTAATSGFPDPQLQAWAASWNVMGRAAKADEVSPMVSFLASDKASFVTGATFDVDGGAVVA